jgi:hypothetical protein
MTCYLPSKQKCKEDQAYGHCLVGPRVLGLFSIRPKT